MSVPRGGRGGGREPTAAERAIGLAFLLSAAASVGLVVVYLRGGQPQLEGLLIGLAMGGIGFGLILWAKRLLDQGELVEERERLESTARDRRAFGAAFERGARPLTRRGFLAKLLGLALGAFGVAALFPIRSLGPKPGRSLFRTSWGAGIRLVTSEGRPVTPRDVQVGGIITVFPEGHEGAADSQTILIRVDTEDLHLPGGRETWVPDGNLAYSKICTHAGCPVGLYEESTGRLFCPCHQSIFDVLTGAQPVSGPATRPLPQLPLRVNAEGYLEARGDFTAPVGPAFWNEP